MSELKTNLQEILQEKQEKIIPENIKKDVQIFDITGTYEGSGSSGEGVKLFETEEEMQADSTAQEGDLALVYKEDIQNMTVDTQTQYITFPETVVLPEAVTSSYNCMLQAVDSSAMFDGQIRLSSTSFRFEGYSDTGTITVRYTSTDGINYTRETSITNPVDLGTSVGIYMAEEWNDSFGYFMQIDKTIFNGLYKYDGVNYNIAANQYTLISSNQLLPDISAYGKNGNITGDGSITNAANSFADIPAMLYSQIQAKYDNMEPRVLTDEDKEIDDNIYIIPTKSDGTVLLDTSQVTNMNSMFNGCTSLTEIPLIDTSAVINMGGMFNGCTSLTEIPLIDTSTVTNMYSMFNGCTSLTTIPQLDTSAVTDMNFMFYGCTSLTTIPQLDTSAVTDMSGMFRSCTSLSNDSLNNILAMLTNATAYTRTKTLRYIGLSETQATTCTTLSNWTACQELGWTTGYETV